VQANEKKENGPVSSEISKLDLRMKGTGTVSLTSPTPFCVEVDEPAGEYRYSIKINFPSGGTNDRILSLAHHCKLGSSSSVVGKIERIW
jgi:hypothetical protein